jgi:hypothetical protein
MAEKFYFAWINEGDAFDADTHSREDELVYSFDLSQSEGDFAQLQVVLKNPRIGLLAPGRKQWCYFSFDDGTGVVPWFKGRLVGIPSNVFDTLVTLNFIAKPTNFEAQKADLAESLKVLPYYDPIFISPDSWGDPDTVLEAYSVLWHIDPVTHVVTVSDIVVPEDGVIVVDDSNHFYDSMSVTLNQTPLRAVSMIATIPWTQSDQNGNVVDLAPRIKQAFGTDYNGVITSFTMPGLVDDWPKQGDKFSNGWEVSAGSQLVDVSFSKPIVPIPDIFSWQGTIPRLAEGSFIYPLKVTGEYHSGEKAGYNFQFELVVVQKGWAVPALNVSYSAEREFAQVVTFTLRTDTQAVITDPGDEESTTITLNANKVSDPSEFGDVPIGDIRARDYIHSPRGMLSVEHLLLVARAHLCARSRAVETSYVQGLKQGAPARSLRKGVVLHDHRLPGGQALGKIVRYHYSLSGDDGEALAEISLASCVGYGGTYSASAGEPTWVDDGWVDPGWQEYKNEVVLTDTADIQWTISPAAFFDDGLDFIRGLNSHNAVKSIAVTHSAGEQEAALTAASDGPNTDQSKISSVLQAIPTQVAIQMVPMEGGPFQQEVVISVSDLILPQQIDLEAASNA